MHPHPSSEARPLFLDQAIDAEIPEADRIDLQQCSRSHTTARWLTSVQRVLVYMEAHLEEKQCSEGLASIGAFSRFHFNRVFRQLTGIPPACYLAALRLEYAKSLLITTDRSVTDICLDVGYSSLGTFVSRFTQMVGVSPTAIRRAAQLLDGVDLRNFLQHEPPPQTIHPRTILGEIRAPSQFRGIICVGLFDTPLPSGRPLQCATLTDSGEFAFGQLASGHYVVAAAALPFEVRPSSFLSRGLALREASRTITIGSGNSGGNVGPLKLSLRPTNRFDPPILAPLPIMLTSRRAAEHLQSRSAGVETMSVI